MDDREETATTAPMLERLWQEAAQLHDGLDRRDVIGAYAGLRAKLVSKITGSNSLGSLFNKGAAEEGDAFDAPPSTQAVGAFAIAVADNVV